LAIDTIILDIPIDLVRYTRLKIELSKHFIYYLSTRVSYKSKVVGKFNKGSSKRL